MKKVVRKFEKTGVRITVISEESEFNVLIDVQKGSKFNEKRNSKHFTVKFHTPDGINIADKDLHYELKNLQYNPKTILKNFKRKFYFSPGLRCSISIAPESYLSPSMIKQYHIARERVYGKSPKEKDDCTLRPAHKPKSGRTTSWNGTGPVPYSKSNVSKPFQGGGFSPK